MSRRSIVGAPSSRALHGLGRLAIAAAAASIACADDAPDAAQLLLPSDFEIHWDASYNRVDDGLGALVPVDVMVYEGSSGAPLDAVEVFMETDYDGVALVDADGFRIVDPAECVAGPECAALYDAEHDEYIALAHPDQTGLQLRTDPDGLARVYLYVDAFPRAGGDGVSVLVSMGDQSPGPGAQARGGARITDGSFRLLPR